MVLKMFSREFAVFIVLAAAVLSSGKNFISNYYVHLEFDFILIIDFELKMVSFILAKVQLG